MPISSTYPRPFFPDDSTVPRPQAMSARNLWREYQAPAQLMRLALSGSRLLLHPRSRPKNVLLIPGWLAPEESMAPMRKYLRVRGHDARLWGLGSNQGDPEENSRKLVPILEAFAKEAQGAVTLVGWSLGGVIAREAARLAPHLVQSVVTLGTPVVGGPIFTFVAKRWPEIEAQKAAELSHQRDRDNPIRAEILSVFSKHDVVVSWPACIDRLSPRVQHFEVGSSHVGMAFDPDVFELLRQHLETNSTRISLETSAY